MKLFTLAAALLATTSIAAVAGPLDGKTWDDIVAQAKQEGQLTWYVWYLQDELRAAIKPFEEEYGIKVTIPEGGLDANFSKLLAEKSRERGDIDVFSHDFTGFDNVNRSEFFQKLDILPADDGRYDTVAGVNGQGYVLAFWGNQTGIAYDTSVLSEDQLPQTPEEFAQFWQDNPGKFGFNYEKGGSGPSFYQNVVRVVSGVDFSDKSVTDERIAGLQAGYDFFNEYADDYVITASNADSITRLSDRELVMVPTWEDFLAGLQKSGEVRKEIAFYIPEMGMNGGGNGVAIPVNAPHPAAAAVFTDWLTSAQTQAAFNARFGSAPMNKASDSSNALIPQEQRSRSVAQGQKPFIDSVVQGFIDNVILER